MAASWSRRRGQKYPARPIAAPWDAGSISEKLGRFDGADVLRGAAFVMQPLVRTEFKPTNAFASQPMTIAPNTVSQPADLTKLATSKHVF